ncbi:Hydroxymethylglutaryl-CoA lyase YngG [compost metagenome]
MNTLADDRQVAVREVSLRDGIQSLAPLATDKKLEWFRLEAAAGVPAFEITSFVPARVIPQFYDAEQVVAGARATGQSVLSALVLNEKGARRAIDAGVQSITFVVSASATHSGKNARTTPEEALSAVEALIASLSVMPERPQISGAISTAFGCTYEGNVDSGRVLAMAERLAKAGVDEIGLADTVGFAGPRQVHNLFSNLRKAVGNLPITAHFHDTRGMGMANVLAALEAGVRRFDASLGGVGGCPFAPGATGNIATEDLCFLLDEYGLQTGIDLERLLEARRSLTELLPGEPLHGALSRAGLPRPVASQ